MAHKCPSCFGSGREDCLCGGDLCTCENAGETHCHICGGEGLVPPEHAALYHQRRRRHQVMMLAYVAIATLFGYAWMAH